MENFDIGKAKIASIICVILFIFVMVVANAYKYLPEENFANISNDTEYSDTVDNNKEYEHQELDETTDDETNIEENKVSEIDDEKIKSTSNTKEYEILEPISENENINDEKVTDTYEQVFKEANQLIKDKKLIKAIEGFQNAISLAETNGQKADCYEKVSTIYGISKQYGKALALAQKAYNLSPSTNREMLLARLYYKTGNIDKATDRVNNILNREFSSDR